MCPRVLNCLHVFCEKCILQLANVNSMFSVLNIICPICSQPTTVSDKVLIKLQHVQYILIVFFYNL